MPSGEEDRVKAERGGGEEGGEAGPGGRQGQGGRRREAVDAETGWSPAEGAVELPDLLSFSTPQRKATGPALPAPSRRRRPYCKAHPSPARFGCRGVSAERAHRGRFAPALGFILLALCGGQHFLASKKKRLRNSLLS